MIVRDDTYIGFWLTTPQKKTHTKKKLGECLVPFTKVGEIKDGACVGRDRGGKITSYGSLEFEMPVNITHIFK